MDDKLKACKDTRKIAVEALANTLRVLLKKDVVSEVEFRDCWLKELRKNSEIFPDGWYTPPPNGVITMFATDKDPARILHPNMRLEETWPRDDIFLDKNNGLIALYASPVGRTSGIIGDTEVLIYLGKNDLIINTYKTCLAISRKIFEFVRVGRSFGEIAKFAADLADRNMLTNNIFSSNDPNGVNIGHTVPASYEQWTDEERIILENGDTNWAKVCEMISKKRVFVNESENIKVKAPMVFTIEPRFKVLGREDMPSIWTHSLIFLKEDGSKEFFTGYDEIFKICGMDYLLGY